MHLAGDARRSPVNTFRCFIVLVLCVELKYFASHCLLIRHVARRFLRALIALLLVCNFWTNLSGGGRKLLERLEY